MATAVQYNTVKDLKVSDAKLQITQTKSMIGVKPVHRETVRSLGLKRVSHTVVRDADAVTVGMLNTVKHLVTVEEAK
ncbi:MAG: 50S ribosomal protein L30 [Nesterenkonia sp.]